jgi:hypothetical protein
MRVCVNRLLLERLILGEGSSGAGDFDVVVAVASSPVAAASTYTRANVALLASLVLGLFDDDLVRFLYVRG